MTSTTVVFEKKLVKEHPNSLTELKKIVFPHRKEAEEWVRAIKSVDREIQYINFKMKEQ